MRRARSGPGPEAPSGSFCSSTHGRVSRPKLALAEFPFDDEKAVVRPRHERSGGEKRSVARVIGAPPGYVGYEEGGALTEAVRRRPLLSRAARRGREARTPKCSTCCCSCSTTAGSPTAGRTVDFRNTIIIMTSNLGSDAILEYGRGRPPRWRRARAEGVARALPARTLNRLDDIVIFPLAHPRPYPAGGGASRWRARARAAGGAARKDLCSATRRSTCCRRGLRPSLRRAAAQTHDPAAAAEPAGHAALEGHHPGDLAGVT